MIQNYPRNVWEWLVTMPVDVTMDVVIPLMQQGAFFFSSVCRLTMHSSEIKYISRSVTLCCHERCIY